MDKRELQVAMHAAWNAGLDEGLVTTWLSNAEPIIRLERGGLEGYIFANPTHVIIAFQGTDLEYDDIRTDLNYKKVRLSGIPGRWHEGFVSGAGRFWVEILLWLKHNLGGRKLLITGFSLGGALAQATSIYLSQAHVDHTVYAFGSPRVANRRAGAWLANRTEHYRVRTTHDWVPHLPPFFFGFKHFGEKLVIGERKQRHGHHRLTYLLLILAL